MLMSFAIFLTILTGALFLAGSGTACGFVGWSLIVLLQEMSAEEWPLWVRLASIAALAFRGWQLLAPDLD